MITPDDGGAGFEADGGHAGIFSTLIAFIPNDNPGDVNDDVVNKEEDDDDDEEEEEEEEDRMEDLE